MGAYDWPGIPDGFDAVRRGRHMFLILRADVGVAVLSGMTSREPLMLHARAERATDMEKATALSARLTEMPAAQAIGLVVGWWRDHVKACVEGGLGLPHDDMRESLKANEGESFQTIPASLNAWRRGRQRQIEQDRIARRISAAVQIDDYESCSRRQAAGGVSSRSWGLPTAGRRTWRWRGWRRPRAATSAGR